VYRSILAKQPDDRPATSGLLLVLVEMLENPAGVLKTVQSALAKHPDDPDLLFAQATIERKRGDLDAALKTYDRVLKLLPGDREAAAQKARVLVRMAKQSHSVWEPKLIEEALAVSGNAPDIRAEYVTALAAAGRTDKAIREYEALPRSWVQTLGLMKTAARCYRARKMFDKAITLYQTVLEKQGSDAEATRELMLTLSEMGEVGGATQSRGAGGQAHAAPAKEAKP
jgi:tetratricopeptide (TPR) repeat protein